MPITDQELRELRGHAKQLRKDIIDVTFWAGGAHIGGHVRADIDQLW